MKKLLIASAFVLLSTQANASCACDCLDVNALAAELNEILAAPGNAKSKYDRDITGPKKTCVENLRKLNGMKNCRKLTDQEKALVESAGHILDVEAVSGSESESESEH